MSGTCKASSSSSFPTASSQAITTSTPWFCLRCRCPRPHPLPHHPSPIFTTITTRHILLGPGASPSRGVQFHRPPFCLRQGVSSRLQSSGSSSLAATISLFSGSEPSGTQSSGSIQLTTSTVLSTATITMCPSTGPYCPAMDRTTFVTTETLVFTTTVCPFTEAEGISISRTASPVSVTSTIFSTYTATSPHALPQ